MLSRGAILAALLAISCGKGSGDGRAGPGRDWSGEALRPVEQKIGGAVVELSLPDGLRLESEEPDRVQWIADQEDYFSEPSIILATVTTPPTTLEEAVTYSMPGSEEEVVRKEAIDGGHIVTTRTPDRGLVQVYVWRKLGDETISCSASQARGGGVPSFQETRAWLESICLSMRAR